MKSGAHQRSPERIVVTSYVRVHVRLTTRHSWHPMRSNTMSLAAVAKKLSASQRTW